MFAIAISLFAATPTPDIKADCTGSTPEIAACYEVAVDKSKSRMQSYFDRALQAEAEDTKTVAKMRRSQKAFETYRDAECQAVLQSWSMGGTARPIFVQSCYLALNDQRTHQIWSSWLRAFGDNEPDLMPEPEPTPTE